jgi:hypothetical protein
MVRSARNIAAAVLVAGVVITGTSHASSLSTGPSFTRQGANASLGSGSSWSLDWLYSFLRGSWAKASGTLSPNGASSAAQSPTPSAGGTLDPNGSPPPPAPSAVGALKPRRQ